VRSPAPSKETTTKSGGLPVGNFAGKVRVTGAAFGAFTPGVSVFEGSGSVGVGEGFPGVIEGVVEGLVEGLG
jgi:hypothetical protein